MRPTVLLDCDGTLIDSNEARIETWLEVFRQEKIYVEPKRMVKLIGLDPSLLISVIAGFPPSSGKNAQLIERHQAIFARNHAAKVRAQPGASELLARLSEENVQTVLFDMTSNGEELAQRLKRLKLAPTLTLTRPSRSLTFDLKALMSQTLNEANSKSGLDRQTTTVIGVTPYCADLAAALGLPFIGLLCGGWHSNAFGSALAIYRDPVEILQRSRLNAQPLMDGVLNRAANPRAIAACVIPFPL